MSNKICLSEKELDERIGRKVELDFTRLMKDTTNKITEKYEEMLKETTKSEVEKVNEYIKTSCPEHSAIVFIVDRNEITVPVEPNSEIVVDDELRLTYEDIIDENKLEEVMNYLSTRELVKFKTVTGRDVEMYDEDKFGKENKIEKINKTYFTTYCAYIPANKVIGVYLVNAKLK